MSNCTSISIRDRRCPGRDSTAVECSDGWYLSVVRRGMYVRHSGSESEVATAANVLAWVPGQEYRVTHPAPGGDDVTIFALSPELVGELSHTSRRPGDRTLPWTSAPIDGTTYLLHWRAWRSAQAGADPLAAEELALAFISALVGPGGSRTGPGRGHARLLARKAAEVAGACFRERVLLGDIARQVGCSPWHLCRSFRATTGVSLHRYITSLRLRQALYLISESDLDLSRIALDCGFATHSHFTDTFRREFRVTPSSLRRRGRWRTIAKGRDRR